MVTTGWLGESVLKAQAEVATWPVGMRPEGLSHVPDEALHMALDVLDQRRRVIEGELALRKEFG